jgi:hypothetical protein
VHIGRQPGGRAGHLFGLSLRVPPRLLQLHHTYARERVRQPVRPSPVPPRMSLFLSILPQPHHLNCFPPNNDYLTPTHRADLDTLHHARKSRRRG